MIIRTTNIFRRQFLQRALVLPSVLALNLTGLGAAGKSSRALEIGVGPHLFIDDYLIESQSHLERVIRQPVRLPSPIVTGPEDKNFQPYVTVVRDSRTQLFRMWYDVPATPLVASPSRLAYLESNDGVHWLRPHRVLENPGGLEVRFGASVIDEGQNSSDPTRRFKLGWNWGNFKAEAPIASDAGLMIAVSPDGFDWTPISPNPPVVAHNHDINNIFYDPIRKRYLATLSTLVSAPDGKGKRRQPVQCFSTDLLHWSEPWPVIVPDGKDEGEFQYYAMSAYLARGGLLIGFAKVLRDDLPADPGGPVAGIGYSVLTWSRDGVHWQRDREPFLDRNSAPGTWDHAMSWIDCQLPVGDELFLYYGGYARGHKVERFTERQIGLARMPRDRYVARRAGSDVGTLRTPPLLLDLPELTVNATIKDELRVRVLDGNGQPVAGYDWSDCAPINGDAIGHPVRWSKSSEELRGQSVQLEFTLRHGELYGFELGPSAPKTKP